MRVPDPGWRLTKRMSLRARSASPRTCFGLPRGMNSLLAPCQVDQHMARIVEPRPVDLRALRAKRRAADGSRRTRRGQAPARPRRSRYLMSTAACASTSARRASRPRSRATHGYARRRAARAAGSGRSPLRRPACAGSRRAGCARGAAHRRRPARAPTASACRARFRSVPRRCTPRAHAACPTRADKTALSLARPAQCCPCRPRVRATARHPTGWPHGLPCRVRSDTRRIRCESIMYSDFLLRPPNLPLIVGRNQSERSRDAHYMNLERI